MFRYNETLMSNCEDYKIQEQVTSDVYYTYNALVAFNNTLDKNVINAFTSLDKFIQEHEDIKESKDSRCKSYYDKMIYWNNKYKTESSDATIKLSESTINLIKEYKKWQEAYKLVSKQRRISKDDRVFPSINGDYIFPGTCDHILRKIVKKV